MKREIKFFETANTIDPLKRTLSKGTYPHGWVQLMTRIQTAI